MATLLIDQVRCDRDQPSEDKLARLSQHEHRVLALLAEGNTNQEIAQRLGQSLGTAKARVSSILAKLGVRRRAEAVAYFAQQHLSGDDSHDA